MFIGLESTDEDRMAPPGSRCDTRQSVQHRHISTADNALDCHEHVYIHGICMLNPQSGQHVEILQLLCDICGELCLEGARSPQELHLEQHNTLQYTTSACCWHVTS
jgi:hypothetical protein